MVKMRLIDADELKKQIEDFHCKDCDNYNFVRCRACHIDDAITYLDEAQTIGGWIKCTPDTMPETNDEVLTTYIVNGNKKQRFVESASWFYDGEEGHWNSAWDEYRVAGTRIEVLAWMPMPEPYMD